MSHCSLLLEVGHLPECDGKFLVAQIAKKSACMYQHSDLKKYNSLGNQNVMEWHTFIDVDCLSFQYNLWTN